MLLRKGFLKVVLQGDLASTSLKGFANTGINVDTFTIQTYNQMQKLWNYISVVNWA